MMLELLILSFSLKEQVQSPILIFMIKGKLEIIGIAAPQISREGLPLYLSPVKAGFPSPADDFIDRKLDLHEYLVHNEAATFFLRAQGDSMTGAGIHDGDLLIVDRSIEASHNKIVIAAIDGELTVKRLQRTRRAKMKDMKLWEKRTITRDLRAKIDFGSIEDL